MAVDPFTAQAIFQAGGAVTNFVLSGEEARRRREARRRIAALQRQLNETVKKEERQQLLRQIADSQTELFRETRSYRDRFFRDTASTPLATELAIANRVSQLTSAAGAGGKSGYSLTALKRAGAGAATGEKASLFASNALLSRAAFLEGLVENQRGLAGEYAEKYLDTIDLTRTERRVVGSSGRYKFRASDFLAPGNIVQGVFGRAPKATRYENVEVEIEGAKERRAKERQYYDEVL